MSPSTPPAPDALPLGEHLPHLLDITARQVSRLVSRRLEETVELTFVQWRVLSAVSHGGVMSPSRVSETTALDKVKISRAVADLIDRGLLRQSGNPHDRRSHLLRLTARGGAIHRRTLPVMRELEASLAAQLSQAEWRTLSRTLKKLQIYIGSLETANANEMSW